MKKVKRFPGIVISFSYLKDSASTTVKRGTMVLTRYLKGVPFGNGRYTKEVPFLSKMVRGWTSGRSLLIWIFVESPPPPPPGLYLKASQVTTLVALWVHYIALIKWNISPLMLFPPLGNWIPPEKLAWGTGCTEKDGKVYSLFIERSYSRCQVGRHWQKLAKWELEIFYPFNYLN